jgi:hypothetical protein
VEKARVATSSCVEGRLATSLAISWIMSHETWRMVKIFTKDSPLSSLASSHPEIFGNPEIMPHVLR